MAQTTYSRSPSAAAFSGQLDDAQGRVIESYVNDEGSDIPAGVAVVLKAAGTCDLFDNTSDAILGITVNSFARNPDDLSGTAAIKNGDVCNVLRKGCIWVTVEVAVSVTDPVYCRFSAGGSEQLGAFRNNADTSKARLVRGARFLTATSGAGVALLSFDGDVDNGTLGLS